MWLITALTLGVLLFVVAYILGHGLPHLTWTFLSEAPRSMGREGGVLPMIVGTLWCTILAVLVAAPVGVATAIYLTEYTREGRLTSIIRFGADCLAGIPSIIFGLFGFVFFVITLGMGFSILPGSLTWPSWSARTIIRTAEEAIRRVPLRIRDVIGHGLGSTRWQMVTRVVLRSALPGICTGIVLSVGRSVSETAACSMLLPAPALGFPGSALESSATLAPALLHHQLREGISMPRLPGHGRLAPSSPILASSTSPPPIGSMRRFVARVV